MSLSWWDRLCIGIAPRWGMNRVRARAAAQVMQRHYQAAAGGRRTSGWKRFSSDADQANGPNLAALREVSRDLRRNNGWARRGVQVIANNTVGWGIHPKPDGASRQAAKRSMEIWHQWADSTDCDFEGRLNFYGLQRLVMQTVAESGEAIVVRRFARADSGMSVPLQLRVVEPDLLDTSKDSWMSEGGGFTLQGIEFDSLGRRVAYWMFPQHPGGQLAMAPRYQSQRVPAQEVLHIYDVERAGQNRGVPWLCAAIRKLHDFDDYDDALLMKAKIEACFGAFVTDVEGQGGGIGGQGSENPPIDSLEPGMVESLPPGKDVKFAQPSSTSDYQSFSRTNLMRIASSIGVTYEDLTGDYSQVNFSSARMARHSHYANVHHWRHNMLIPQLCSRVWRWLMSDASSLGLLRVIPRSEWTPPPMPMLEPDREGRAYRDLIRAGVRTLPQVIQELGEDPETHLQEIADSNEKLDELEVVLDSDPRRTSASGQMHPDTGSGGAQGGGDDQEAGEE